MQVISVDHHVPDPAVIARLGRGADALAAALSREPSIGGVVVLATCARVEAYLDSDRAHEPGRLFAACLAGDTGLPAGRVADLTRTRHGVDALEHAFRVTAGLESAVVGESQITGQVRDALARARARGTVNRPIGMALENALRVSRMARGILGTSRTSIADVALDLLPANRRVGTALVIGTGTFADVCTLALRKRGVHTVWAHSPSGRTRQGPGIDAIVPADELVDAIAVSDVVVAASGAGRTVVDRRMVERAARLAAQPIVIVDLAGGSDVGVDADAVPDAVVIRLDAVRRSSSRAHAAADLVRREALALSPRLASSALDDVVVAMRRAVEEATAGEWDRAGDAQSRAAIHRLTQALLHEPTLRARQAAQEGRLEHFRAAMETVFGPVTPDPAALLLATAAVGERGSAA